MIITIFSAFFTYVHSYMDPAYFVKFSSLLACSLGKPHNLAFIVYSRFSQPEGHWKIFDGSVKSCYYFCSVHVQVLPPSKHVKKAWFQANTGVL